MACSQNRSTTHPAASNLAFKRTSRARLRRIFMSQKRGFVWGTWKCVGHPCQKQPSTKTATLAAANTMSGRAPSMGVFVL
jgi:hypothetical protein